MVPQRVNLKGHPNREQEEHRHASGPAAELFPSTPGTDHPNHRGVLVRGK